MSTFATRASSFLFGRLQKPNAGSAAVVVDELRLATASTKSTAVLVGGDYPVKPLLLL
jgi:hypothetical protein